MTISEPGRHHFIPAFYIRRWANAFGQVVRYTKPCPGVIVDRLKHPDGVGWQRDLYRMPDVPLANQQFVEKEVFRDVDQKAAIALRKLNEPRIPELSGSKADWSTFIISLWQRAPSNVSATVVALDRLRTDGADFRERYGDVRGRNDPLTYDEFVASYSDDDKAGAGIRVIANSIRKSRVARFLHSLEWHTLDLTPDCPQLLLSDDPVARYTGMTKPDGHFAMPLSPTRLLYGAGHAQALRWLGDMKPMEFAKNLNAWTVESAREFVVAPDLRQDRFIRNRFGLSPKPFLAEAAFPVDKPLPHQLVRSERGA